MATVGWFVTVTALIQCVFGAADIFEQVYMTEKCNQGLVDQISGRFETSTSLTYDNNMDCSTTISVDSGSKILLLFNRLEIEEPLQGNCLDYLKVHNGGSTSASTIHSEPALCGTIIGPFNMTSSGSSVTFHFVSDNTAVLRGFDVVYTAFTSPPCSADFYECAHGACIDGQLRCDDVDQCLDGSDEVSCPDEDFTDDESSLPLGIIIGCSLAVLVLIIIIVIIIWRLYVYYKWRQFVRHQPANLYDDSDLYSYPKTDKYTVLDVGRRGRRQPDVASYVHQFSDYKTGEINKAYLDEQ